MDGSTTGGADGSEWDCAAIADMADETGEETLRDVEVTLLDWDIRGLWELSCRDEPKGVDVSLTVAELIATEGVADTPSLECTESIARDTGRCSLGLTVVVEVLWVFSESVTGRDGTTTVGVASCAA